MGLKTIFLVDDDEDDRFIFRDALKSRDPSITIVEFDNGIDLLSSINGFNNETCTLVLLDINMPRMDGLEVLTALRAQPVCQHLPVIVISTASNVDQVQQIKDKGGSGFFAKPYSVDQMEKILDAIDSYLATCGSGGEQYTAG